MKQLQVVEELHELLRGVLEVDANTHFEFTPAILHYLKGRFEYLFRGRERKKREEK